MTHRIPPTMDEANHMMPLEVERGDLSVSRDLSPALSGPSGRGMRCKPCNAPRAVSPCHKCGGELFEVCEGWDETALPDIARIRALAREVGYAVGVHGSLERDVDLIAAPWTEDAVSAPELAAHIAVGLPGRVMDDAVQDKPNGRWSCNIAPDGWFKMIDLSVCPTVKP